MDIAPQEPEAVQSPTLPPPALLLSGVTTAAAPMVCADYEAHGCLQQLA